MDEHDGLAAVQFLENGRVGGVAEPLVAIAAEQCDSVRVKSVQRIFHFDQAALWVRQGQGRQQAKIRRMVFDKLRAEVIALSRQAAPGLSCIERDAGNGE